MNSDLSATDNITIRHIIETPEFMQNKNYFKHNLKRMIFRRIENITNIGNLIVIIYQTPFVRFEFNSIERYQNFCVREGIDYDNKNTLFYYNHYSFISKTVLRGNDPTFISEDHTFYGDTVNYGVLNEEHLIIQKMEPHPNVAMCFPLPKVGQLVCGYNFDQNNYGLWFPCSEQLLHAFSAILSEETVTLYSPIAYLSYVDENDEVVEEEFDYFHSWEQEIVSSKEKVNKYGKHNPSLQDQYNNIRDLMSGNKLSCNSYLKWYKGCEQNGVASFFCRQSEDLSVLTCPELEKRYVNLFTESLSIKYVHFYAFFVLVFKFNIFPDFNTIPKNLEKDFPNMKEWDIPYWCKYFINQLPCSEPCICKNYLKI